MIRKNMSLIFRACLLRLLATNSKEFSKTIFSLGPRGEYLALGSIQCFIVVSIAPESPDSKSAGCEAVTLGEIELFTF